LKGQTGREQWPLKRTVIGTLLLSDLGLTNVTEEPGMGGAALDIMPAGLVQTQLSVHCKAHIGGVAVLLAVVLPPAHRAEAHGVRNFQSLVAAARAAKAGRDSLHV